jgi:hypothetical protein
MSILHVIMSNIALVAVLAITAYALYEYLGESIADFRRLPGVLQLAVLRKTFGRRGKLFGFRPIFGAWMSLVIILMLVLFWVMISVAIWPEERASNVMALIAIEVVSVAVIVLIACRMSYVFKRNIRWAMWIRTSHVVYGIIKTVRKVKQGMFEISFCSQSGQSQLFILRTRMGEKPIFPSGAASIFFEVIAGQRIIRFVSEMSVP